MVVVVAHELLVSVEVSPAAQASRSDSVGCTLRNHNPLLRTAARGSGDRLIAATQIWEPVGLGHGAGDSQHLALWQVGFEA